MGIRDWFGRRRIFKQVYSLIDTGCYDECLALLEQRKAGQSDRRFLFAYATCYHAQGAYDKALAATDEALEKEAKNPAFLLLKAKILFSKGCYERSLELCAQALANSVFNEETLYIMAKNQLALGNKEKAGALFYRALQTADRRFVESRLLLACEWLLMRDALPKVNDNPDAE